MGNADVDQDGKNRLYILPRTAMQAISMADLYTEQAEWATGINDGYAEHVY